MRIWGLSATLGNLDEALERLLAGAPGRVVRGVSDKAVVIDTLIPADVERFPWAGHLGLAMLPEVVAALESSRATLVFTNTRSQAEIWYQALLEARPDWAGLVALHHGSLDAEVRRWVEEGLKEGRLKAVVATSSLDLGVDFSPGGARAADRQPQGRGAAAAARRALGARAGADEPRELRARARAGVRGGRGREARGDGAGGSRRAGRWTGPWTSSRSTSSPSPRAKASSRRS